MELVSAIEFLFSTAAFLLISACVVVSLPAILITLGFIELKQEWSPK